MSFLFPYRSIVVSFLTLLFLAIFFPLFPGQSSWLFPLPYFLALGPLVICGLFISFYQGEEGESMGGAFRKVIPLAPIGLLTSLLGALLFSVPAFFLLIFELFSQLPILGVLVNVLFLSIPLLLYFFLFLSLLLIPISLFILVPLVRRSGWEMKLLQRDFSLRLRQSWFADFGAALLPLLVTFFLLYLACQALKSHFLGNESPFLPLQWFFLSPVWALILSPGLTYFFWKAENSVTSLLAKKAW